MAYLTMKDIEDFALGEARRWIARRRRQLAHDGRILHAVVAFGPLVQHSSADELDLLEIVDELPQGPQSADITHEIKLDRRFLGRVALLSLTPEGFAEALKARAPLVLHVLEGFNVLLDEIGVAQPLSTARRNLRTA